MKNNNNNNNNRKDKFLLKYIKNKKVYVLFVFGLKISTFSRYQAAPGPESSVPILIFKSSPSSTAFILNMSHFKYY